MVKGKRASLAKVAGRAAMPGIVYHLDLCGPFIASLSGSLLMLVVVDSFSRTKANPGNISPHEAFTGRKPDNIVLAFFQPGLMRVEKAMKIDDQAVRCYFLNFGYNHARNTVKVLRADTGRTSAPAAASSPSPLVSTPQTLIPLPGSTGPLDSPPAAEAAGTSTTAAAPLPEDSSLPRPAVTAQPLLSRRAITELRPGRQGGMEDLRLAGHTRSGGKQGGGDAACWAADAGHMQGLLSFMGRDVMLSTQAVAEMVDATKEANKTAAVWGHIPVGMMTRLARVEDIEAALREERPPHSAGPAAVPHILQDVTKRLAPRDADGAIKEQVGVFDEVVFAGVGEPLLRWSVVKEVVRSLKTRHAHLLRPREPPTANPSAAVAPGQAELTNGQTTSTAPLPCAAMPVRLVTNGFWPAASGQFLSSCSCCPTIRASASGSTGTPAAAAAAAAEKSPQRGSTGGDASSMRGEGDGDSAARAERRQSQCSGPSRGRKPIPEADVSAASVASEITELFDSVSVALNTADPLQYDELMKPLAHGVPRTQPAHSLVCDLVTECVAQGLPTECTVVDRNGVDVARAQELATALGASCRVRPYFPSGS
eukprot:g6272.t1